MPGDGKRGQVRVVIAIVVLAGLAALAVYGGVVMVGRSHEVAAILFCGTAVLSVLAAVAGLARGRWWARWLGLGHGVACTIYGGLATTVYLSHSPSLGEGLPLFGLALAGPLLLACLSGRTMFDRFERPAGKRDGVRAGLVRWAAITNLSSIFLLALLSVASLSEASVSAVERTLALLSTLLVLAGVALLARGKTLGILLSAAACLAQAAFIVSMRPIDGPGLFGSLMSPGLILATAATAAYAAPIWRFLRGR